MINKTIFQNHVSCWVSNKYNFWKVAMIFNYNYYIKKGSKFSSDQFFLIFLITSLPSP